MSRVPFHALKFMDKEMFRRSISAYIRPSLECVSPVYSPHMMRHVTRSEKARRQATMLLADPQREGGDHGLYLLWKMEGRRENIYNFRVYES